MTSPSDFKERFIAFDSFSLSILVLGLDLLSLSDPAKSTNDILLLETYPVLLFLVCITTLKTKWERLDISFISVDADFRDLRPMLNVSRAS